MITQHLINALAYRVVGCAIEVHRHLGPGLLESIYHTCLLEEIRLSGMSAASQVLVPVSYKGQHLGKELKIDILVEKLIVIELKAVEVMIPLYQAQLLTYLKLTDKPKGLLINFNCEYITSSLKSMVTDRFAALPKK
jgi:GxxExxY protein